MCGIFGVTVGKNSNFSTSLLKSTVDNLFKLSESRGKEASGLAFFEKEKKSIKVYKKPEPASFLIHDKKYKKIFGSSLTYPLTILGHARLVTNGTLENNKNNQPVVKDGIVGIHNGIIVNDEKLWKDFHKLTRNYEVDTEVILSLVRFFLNKAQSLPEAVRKTFKQIEGSASIGLLFNDINYLLLATNTGSLYIYHNKDNRIFIFASERYILETLLKKTGLDSSFKISQVLPEEGYLIDISDLAIEKFSFNKKGGFRFQEEIGLANFKIIDFSPKSFQRTALYRKTQASRKMVEISYETLRAIRSLKRCAKCILPETMPFIEFDKNGVCNYCKNYQNIKIKGEAALRKAVAPYRSKNGEPDCIVAFSGGRDSSYALHYVKNILKMNPVAYSYDWGMLTDLGRRNQARMCGKLGVEHIIISADIRQKRENIRKNVLAWLKKPDLGMVLLFMAGDKQYFYYANKLRKQLGIDLIIYSENPFEKTDFKSGFCGIPPKFNIKHAYNLGLLNKTKLAFYYLKQYLSNPDYLNSSLLDTMSAYASSYLIPHDYVYLYRYINWDENRVTTTLISDYNWETAQDIKTTWRIGDGTAAFYNYIYYLVAGFTENDTFRSNQIREGLISRKEALKLVEEENKPRYDSLMWYCNTNGINFTKIIEIINSIPKHHILERFH